MILHLLFISFIYNFIPFIFVYISITYITIYLLIVSAFIYLFTFPCINNSLIWYLQILSIYINIFLITKNIYIYLFQATKCGPKLPRSSSQAGINTARDEFVFQNLPDRGCRRDCNCNGKSTSVARHVEQWRVEERPLTTERPKRGNRGPKKEKKELKTREREKRERERVISSFHFVLIRFLHVFLFFLSFFYFAYSICLKWICFLPNLIIDTMRLLLMLIMITILIKLLESKQSYSSFW